MMLYYYYLEFSDGICIVPVIDGLIKTNTLDFNIEGKNVDRACFKIALRNLAVVGLIKRKINRDKKLYIESSADFDETTARNHRLYSKLMLAYLTVKEVEEYLLTNNPLPSPWHESIAKLISHEKSKSIKRTLFNQLVGVILLPLLMALKRQKLMCLEQIESKPDTNLQLFLTILCHFKIYDKFNNSFVKSEAGEIINQLLNPLCALSLSYMPILRNIPSYMKNGFSQEILHPDNQGTERHVDRPLNLVGTSMAYINQVSHLSQIKNSFLTKVLIRLFDNYNFINQPQFICDTGCGNGILLCEIYVIILKNTIRGKLIDEHPIWLIGIDINKEARDICRENLKKVKTRSLVCSGDISDPAKIANTLKQHNLAMQDGLHIRAFLDHNRIYKPPVRSHAKSNDNFSNFVIDSYITQNGTSIPFESLQHNLIEYLEEWRVATGKYGFVIFDTHTFSDEIMAIYNGASSIFRYSPPLDCPVYS